MPGQSPDVSRFSLALHTFTTSLTGLIGDAICVQVECDAGGHRGNWLGFLRSLFRAPDVI
jgi:hypothetical protein